MVFDLFRKQALRQAIPTVPPWVDAEVAPMVVEFGRDLLFPLGAGGKDKVPPIIKAFSKHREMMWQKERLVLPRMNSRDDLKGPRNLVKASWNGFVFVQFSTVVGSVFVVGESPEWAREIALQAPGGFWIPLEWQSYFEDRSITLPDYVAQKCCVQFLVFRDSYRRACWDS